MVVSGAGAARARTRHPWIYRSQVARVPADVENGALVRVVDERGRALGRAMFSARSQIALRFVRREDEPVDAGFWAGRLEAALARRERVGATGPARRIVFAEADDWPGLIVDQYGDCLCIQALTPAAERLTPEWAALLVERLAPRAIVARNDLKVRRLEGLEAGITVVHGEAPEPFPVRIGTRTFVVDLIGGQKTGAFLDQQENYRAAARYARGKTRVLDAFAGEGGFALHMAAGAGEVEAVEISAAVTARGQVNQALNGAANITWTVANAFDWLHALDAGGARYGAIVLDPPAFAKNRRSVPAARRGYKEINLRALKILEPEGVLVTCSCSYHVSREMLLSIVSEAAADAGRTVELVEIRGQARDHPIVLNASETEYLKCLVLQAR